MEADYENLREAMRWAVARGDASRSLRLVANLWRLWLYHGRITEGREWSEKALALGDRAPASLRTWALAGPSELARAQGDLDRAVEMKEEALELLREVGEEETMDARAGALTDLVHIAAERGDIERGKALYEEAMALRRQVGDPVGIAHAMDSLVHLKVVEGDYAGAAELAEQGVKIIRGDPAARFLLPESLTSLGDIQRRQGQHERARAAFREALEVGLELNLEISAAECLEGLAAGLAAGSRAREAARLWGAAEKARERGSSEHFDRAEHERSTSAARVSVGEDAFAEAWAEGARMSVEDAIRYALDVSSETPSAV